MRRFERQRVELAAAGWRVVVVWECETRRVEELELRLLNELMQVAPGLAGTA